MYPEPSALPWNELDPDLWQNQTELALGLPLLYMQYLILAAAVLAVFSLLFILVLTLKERRAVRHVPAGRRELHEEKTRANRGAVRSRKDARVLRKGPEWEGPPFRFRLRVEGDVWYGMEGTGEVRQEEVWRRVN